MWLPKVMGVPDQRDHRKEKLGEREKRKHVVGWRGGGVEKVSTVRRAMKGIQQSPIYW